MRRNATTLAPSHAANAAASYSTRNYEQQRENEESSLTANCRICGSALRFVTDPIGRLLEICDTPDCLLHPPHDAQPDTRLPPPENDTPRKPRNYVHKRREDSLTGPAFDARHIA